MRTSPYLCIAALAACGAPRIPDPGMVPVAERGPLEVRSDPTRLADELSRSIEEALATQIGFPLRVVARAGAGDEHLVLYAMNGATHWLAHHPQREQLIRDIQACEREGPEPDVADQNCTDLALRDLRESMLIDRLAEPCLADDGEPEGCREIAATQIVFDVEAYCETGFWSLARRSGSGWSFEARGRLPEECLTRVVALQAADLDEDGVEELLLDAMYDDMDYLRLVDEGRARTLSIWKRGAPVLSRMSAIRIGTHSVDMGPMEELRCRYELTGTTRPSLSLECCQEPMPEDDEEPSEESRFATWPPSSECSAHWTESYPNDPRTGFRQCHRVIAGGETPLRAQPDANAEELDRYGSGFPVYVIGERDGWLNVIARERSGWMPLSATRDECASPP